MKTVYIPKGETVRYETLETDRLVVKGCLKVTYGIKAKTISGGGMITAGTVYYRVRRRHPGKRPGGRQRDLPAVDRQAGADPGAVRL